MMRVIAQRLTIVWLAKCKLFCKLWISLLVGLSNSENYVWARERCAKTIESWLVGKTIYDAIYGNQLLVIAHNLRHKSYDASYRSTTNSSVARQMQVMVQVMDSTVSRLNSKRLITLCPELWKKRPTVDFHNSVLTRPRWRFVTLGAHLSRFRFGPFVRVMWVRLTVDFHNSAITPPPLKLTRRVLSTELWKSCKNVHNSDRSYEDFRRIFITLVKKRYC